MLDMIAQAEQYQYRQRERNHAHPYERPQVATLSRFVCTVVIVVVHSN